MAVADAKYKRTSHQDYPNADAYQMLAYCTRLGLRRGWLIYADLNGTEPAGSIVRNAGIELRVTSVNLGGTIEALHASVATLADELRQPATYQV